MPRARTTGITASPAGAAETVIATLAGQSIPWNAPVDFVASVDLSAGTGVTGVTLKLERGTLAGGTVVATSGPAVVAASTRVTLTMAGTDTQASEEAGQQYVLTATCVGASGASTVNAVYLRADW